MRGAAIAIQQRGAAVDAHVGEHPYHCIVATNEDHRKERVVVRRRHLPCDVVALVGNVGGATDTDPLAGEDVLALQLQDRRLGVRRRWQQQSPIGGKGGVRAKLREQLIEAPG